MRYIYQNFLLFSTLFILLGIGHSIHAQGQSKIPTAQFLQSISISNEVITITCLVGCEYDKLSIRLGTELEAINNNGSTTLLNDLAVVTAGATSPGYFLYTVQRTDGGVILKGIHGTEWKELSFETIPNLHQAFNAEGYVY